MEKQKVNLRSIITTAAISAIFTLITSLLLYYINTKKTALEYEILPVSYFKKDSTKLSIASLRIINTGKKELENVSFSISFGDSLKTTEYTFEKSSETITINRIIDSFSRKTYYSIPYLNPDEQIVFSFLLNNLVEPSKIQVSLRSKGVNGTMINKKIDNDISLVLFIGTILMLTLTIGLILFVLIYQRRLEKYRIALDQLQREQIHYLENLLSSNKIEYEKTPPGRE